MDEEKRITSSQLFLRVLAGRGLTGGHPDPYLQVFLDKEKKWKSEVVKGTPEPSWENEKGKLFNINDKVEEIRVVVKDATFLLPDSFLGQVTFSLHSLMDGVPHDEWYSLESRAGKKDKVQGELHIQVMYCERPDGNISDEDFTTPIQVLLRKNKMQVLKALLDKGAGSALEVKDKDDNSPLHVACLLDNPEAVQLLIKKGADVKSKNRKGQTPLHIAAEKSPASIPYLIEGKADIEAKDTDGDAGKRPLHYAAMSNNGKACLALLERGASINSQTEAGNTPLHLALQAGAFEAVKVLASQRKIDIYKKNKAGVHCAAAALKLGGDIKRVFMDSVHVEDDREFDIVDSGFKKRHRIEGDHLTHDFMKSNQFLLTAKNKTEARIICHFIGGVGVVDAAQSKVGFCLVTTPEGKHMEMSYQTSCVGYGGQEPLAVTLEPKVKYAILPYGQEAETKGKFSVLVFTREDDEVELSPLAPWKYCVTEKGEWKGASAGGCNREDTWTNNPRFLLKLPANKKEVELLILLAQQKSTLDIIPFQVHPYSFHIGFYIYNKDVDDIIDRSVWQNAREVYKHIKVDTTKEYHRELVIVPTTVKPGQETSFTISVYSDEPIDLERFKGAKIIDVNK